MGVFFREPPIYKSKMFTAKTFLELPEYEHLATYRANPDVAYSHLVTDPGYLVELGGSVSL